MGVQGEAKVMPLAAFRTAMNNELGWDKEKLSRAEELFSARERPSFLVVPVPASKEDVYFWRFNRALSYLRRPFLRRGGEDGDVVWGVRHLHVTAMNLVGLCLKGRLKANSLEMKRFMGRLQADSAKTFNDSVGAVYAEVPDMIVRTRVQKIGRQRIERNRGEPLGDIDVLVADRRKRRLLAIETKDLEIARTPAEIANELRATFAMGSDPSSDIDRHLERVEWLRNYVAETLEWLGLGAERPRRWKVEGLVVVDRELMAPFLTKAPLPVRSFRDIKKEFASAPVERGVD